MKTLSEMGFFVNTLRFEYLVKSYVSFCFRVRLIGVIVVSSRAFKGFTTPSFATNFSCENTDTGGYVSSFVAKI